MGEGDAVSDMEDIRRVDDYAPHSVNHCQRLEDFDKASSRPLAANPGFGDKFDEGPRTAVQYRQFQVVNLYHSVIHIQSSQGRKKMLGGRDQDAFLHQTGGVANSGHVLGLGFDGESLKVGAPEQNASVSWGWAETKVDLDACVKADAGDGDW
jgi:hypothetical protein